MWKSCPCIFRPTAERPQSWKAQPPHQWHTHKMIQDPSWNSSILGQNMELSPFNTKAHAEVVWQVGSARYSWRIKRCRATEKGREKSIKSWPNGWQGGIKQDLGTGKRLWLNVQSLIFQGNWSLCASWKHKCTDIWLFYLFLVLIYPGFGPPAQAGCGSNGCYSTSYHQTFLELLISAACAMSSTGESGLTNICHHLWV